MGWGSLGEIPFTLLSGPTDFQDKQAADFAEHALIGGKPRLQHLGQKLEEITMNLVLSSAINFLPDADLKILKDAVDAGDPLELVVGEGNSGIYCGLVVITNLDHTRVEQWPNGKIRRAELTIQLKEWVEPPRLGTSKRVGEPPKGLRPAGKTPAPAVQTQVEQKTVNGYTQPVGLSGGG